MFQLFKKSDRFWPVLKWQDWFVVGGALAIFTTLAASTVAKFSIWFDEAFGSYLIRFDYWKLTTYTAADVHPPFYYWLLKTWSIFFGNTELGIRSMSIFFGIVTIIFAFLLVLRLFGRRAAYVTLIFLVLSPVFVRYSQEGRMYTVLTAIILAATYVLVYAEENVKKRWPWVVYGVLIAIGMLTQYFAALAWLAHWLWRYLVVRSPGESWKQTKKKLFSREWVRAHIIAIAVFLPWLPFLIWQFINVQGYGFWIVPLTAATVPDFLANIFFFSDAKSAASWLAFGFYLTLIFMVFLAIRLLLTLKTERYKNYLLIVCMVIVPIILLVIGSMPPLRPAFVDRYLMTTIVFLPILIGVSIALSAHLLKPRVRIGLGAIVALMMIVGIGAQMNLGNYNKSTSQSNNVRQLVEKVREASPNGTPIIGNTPWIFYEAVVYEQKDSPVYFINETTEYKFGSLRMLAENDLFKIKDLDAFTKQHPRFWVISNLRDSEPRQLRPSWKAGEAIVINDDVSKQPLFKAVHFTVE